MRFRWVAVLVVLVVVAGGVTGWLLVRGSLPDTALGAGVAMLPEDTRPVSFTDLASGEAPGQGGTFPERFRVASGTADGPLVTLELEPVDGPVLGDLRQGPGLFATC